MVDQTATLFPTPEGIADAATRLRSGVLVAFPTETVYGLGGDARSARAVAAIYAAKGRPDFNPLIVHVPDLAAAREVGVFDATAERLAAAFWPGPLTLVLPLRSDAGLAPGVTAGLASVALRIPAHPVARALLRAFGGPLAAPSANPSGRISPTMAAHVLAGLGGRINAVLDGGPCTVGVESTIIGLTEAPTLLRAGGIASEAIEQVLGLPLAAQGQGVQVTAPGQLSSHYAPRAALRLNAVAKMPGEVWIGFGPGTGDAGLSLSPTGDLAEAAARLFHLLHVADRDAARIAVAPVPHTGLGRAINDRLMRAAAPRV